MAENTEIQTQDRRTDLRANPAELPRGGDILHAKKINAFLESFTPDSAAETYEKVKAIWQEQGFISPADLTKTLLKQKITETDEAKKQQKNDLIDGIVDASFARDSLTGFSSKPATPLLTGLAHLYGQETGRTIAIVEGDFSNMGGTNLKFKQDLNGERAFDGFEECDIAAKITANIAMDKFGEAVSDHNSEAAKKGESGLASVHAVRSGGDEVRLIVAGLDMDRVNDVLDNKVHAGIEEFTATANLHDHPHTKDPTNRYKEGFGLVFATDDLSNPDLQPHMVIESLDKRIKAKKIELGYLRKGEVPYLDDLKKDLAAQGKTQAEIKKIVSTKTNEAFETGMKYKKLKEPSSLDVVHGARDDKAGQTEYGKYANADATNKELPFKEIEVTDRALFEDSMETTQKRLDLYLQDNGLDSNDADNAVFARALEGYRAIDPPTGVKAPRDLASDAEIFAQDAHELFKLNPELGDNARMMHVEFGNLAGINEISHEHADAVLKHMAGIVQETLEEYGLKDFKNFIYHEGGAKMKVLLPNYAEKTVEEENIASEPLRRTIGFNGGELIENKAPKAKRAIGFGRSEEEAPAELPKAKRPIGFGRQNEELPKEPPKAKRRIGFGMQDEAPIETPDMTKPTRRAIGFGRQDEVISNYEGVVVTDELVQKIQNSITEKTQQQINTRAVPKYFIERHLPVKKHENGVTKPLEFGNGVPLYSGGIQQKFSAMPHPKRPEEKGINVTAMTARLLRGMDGSEQVLALSNEVEVKINAAREALKSAYDAGQTAKKNRRTIDPHQVENQTHKSDKALKKQNQNIGMQQWAKKGNVR